MLSPYEELRERAIHANKRRRSRYIAEDLDKLDLVKLEQVQRFKRDDINEPVDRHLRRQVIDEDFVSDEE